MEPKLGMKFYKRIGIQLSKKLRQLGGNPFSKAADEADEATRKAERPTNRVRIL